MYTEFTGLMLGFHGCSKALADRVIMGTDNFKQSDKPYDWLGHGIYFWEKDIRRALEFASDKKSRGPSAVGAFIDPGNCLDLRCRDNQELLKIAYATYCEKYGALEQKNASYEEDIPLRRDLDCLIIEFACELYYDLNGRTFDTVIGTFLEGKGVYPGAGMRDKTHTQICVRNPNCVLGYFKPRSMK